jgi:hypothetical protein
MFDWRNQNQYKCGGIYMQIVTYMLDK